jgi:hypothetical protein
MRGRKRVSGGYWLTPGEAGEALGISWFRLGTLEKRGILRAHWSDAGYRRFAAADIRAITAAAQAGQATPEEYCVERGWLRWKPSPVPGRQP